MAGTVTLTSRPELRAVTRVEYDWTSDADGDADGNSELRAVGFIVRAVTIPDGTDAPTDNYDIVVNDSDGLDVMAGALANRDTANSEQVFPDPPPAFDSTLEPVISNAGNAKKGKLILYIRREWK